MIPSFSKMKCFVTVGTTRFDELVNLLLTKPTLEVLRSRGITDLIIQSGRSVLSEASHKLLQAVREEKTMKVEVFDYKPTLRHDVEAADIIICHAGAGSIMEALEAGKPTLVIVNEQLMGNHQMELAEKLQQENYLRYATLTTFIEVFTELPVSRTCYKCYPACDTKAFINYLARQLALR